MNVWWNSRYSYILLLFLVSCGGEGGSDNSSAIAPRLLNDTGITLCGDYSSATAQNDLDCDLVGAGKNVNGIDSDGNLVPAGQDAHYGYDVDLRTNYNDDGHAGFSFTRLDSAGNDLSSSAISWSCVRDNNTGLIWEIKTDNTGLRDKDWQYTWYNPDGSNNGANAGLSDTGNGVGSDSCFNHARCDTQKYIADVNEQGLCGHSDWRLPSSEELQSIVSLDRVFPAIDYDYFPRTLANVNYWSATPSADKNQEAWFVNFYDGFEYKQNKGLFAYIRLVRVGKPYKVIHVLD